MAGMHGGYGPPGAAPIRKSGGSGCLLWGAGGCGLLALVSIIGLAVITMKFSRDPRFQKLMSNTVATQSCGQNLVAIRAALNRYRAEHAGKYPPALAALTPKYLPDRSATTCGGEGFQTEYTPPKPDAPADAPIVSFSGSEATIMSVRQMSVSQRIYVRLLKDGRIVSDQVQRTEQSPAGGRAPSAGGSAGP